MIYQTFCMKEKEKIPEVVAVLDTQDAPVCFSTLLRNTGEVVKGGFTSSWSKQRFWSSGPNNKCELCASSLFYLEIKLGEFLSFNIYFIEGCYPQTGIYVFIVLEKPNSGRKFRATSIEYIGNIQQITYWWLNYCSLAKMKISTFIGIWTCSNQ